jgi:hypothetical protein
LNEQEHLALWKFVENLPMLFSQVALVKDDYISLTLRVVVSYPTSVGNDLWFLVVHLDHLPIYESVCLVGKNAWVISETKFFVFVICYLELKARTKNSDTSKGK